LNFDEISRQAQIVWRKESFVGVRFTDERG